MNQKTEQKQKSHDAILASAASLLRKQGIRASSVMDVMKGAGLTVGGFYGHFDSKEQLFAQAIGNPAGSIWARLLSTAKGATSHEKVVSVLGRYLSRTHRDNAQDGCLLPSTAHEVASEGEPYRSALEKKLSTYADSLSHLLGEGQRTRALGLIALMYGGLSLARAVAGTPLSDEFLKAAKALGERSLEPH